MTGKELIMYILRNDLVDKDVLLLDLFIDSREAAAKFSVGVETIHAWYRMGKIKGHQIGECLFFNKDLEDPRKEQV